VLPSAETAAMLFWALMASGQITIRKVDGWQTLGETLAAPSRLTSPLRPANCQPAGDTPSKQSPHNSRRHHGEAIITSDQPNQLSFSGNRAEPSSSGRRKEFARYDTVL